MNAPSLVQKPRILALVWSGFGLLIVFGLATSLFLLLQLRRTVDEGEVIEAATLNVRAAVQSLHAQYMDQELSRALLSPQPDVNVAEHRARKVESDRRAMELLRTAITSTRSKELRRLLRELQKHDQEVTAPLEEKVLALAPTDLPAARELCLTGYLPAQDKNVELAVVAKRLAAEEIAAMAGRSHREAVRAQFGSGLAILAFLGLGIATAFLLTRAVGALVRHASEAARETTDLMDHSMDVICSMSADGRFTKISGACERIWGYRPEDLLGRAYSELVHPDDVEPTHRAAEEIVTGTTSGHFENRYIRKDGAVVNVLWAASWSAERQAFFCVAHDVTERRRADEELRWKTAFLEAQVNSSLDGILVVDEQGKLSLQNQRFLDLLRIPQHLAEEKSDENRVRWVVNIVKNPERFVERVHYLYSHPDEISRDEIELKDGATLDRYSSPVVGKDGKYYGRIWTFRDITERKRAEEAMQESEERFSGAFEHAPIGMALVSPDGRFLKVNRILCGLVGYSEDELLARTFQDITHPEDLEVDQENVRRMVAGEIHTYQIEKRYVHGRGHLVAVLLDVSLVRDRRGQPRYFISQIQDITERKRTENALRESNEKFHQLADNITDAFWIRSPDMREVHYVSRAFERIWGRSVECLYANPHHWADFILPEDRERVLCVFAALTGEKRSVDIEYRIVRPDGEIRWVRVRGFQVRDATDNLIRHTGIVTDITERRRDEEELRESKRFAESIAENSTSFIYLYDLETGSSPYSNRSVGEFLGYSQAQILELGDKLLPTIMHPEDLPRMVGHFAHIAAVPTIREFDIEYRVKHANGDWRWIWARTTVFKRRPNGDVWQTMGTAHDITERKRAEAELETVYKRLLETSRQAGMAEVATSVLHNVGNVLNSVNISCSVVADKVRKSRIASVAKTASVLGEHADDLAAFFTNNPIGQKLPDFLCKLAGRLAEEQAEVLQELQLLGQNIGHIKDIISMQQNYARISGVTETAKATDLVEDSLRMNDGALMRHEVQVIRDYAEVPLVTVEKHKVLQILVNLIRNAKDACDESGRSEKWVAVRVRKGDGCVRIAISDNGVGIPPENLTRVFAHGFTTKKNGHGFGLHSGVLAAQEMGGSLTAQSVGPGTGATFTLELPLSPIGGQ